MGAMIRPLRDADARPLAELHLQVWRAAYGALLPPDAFDAVDLDERTERWRQTARGEAVPPREALVAEQDGRLVGFVAFGAPRDPVGAATGEILALYVAQPSWGAGVGDALLAGARRRLAEQGYRSVYLWVLRDNPRARRFYERGGLAHDGTCQDVDLFGTMLPEVRYSGPVEFAAARERADSST